MRLLLRRPQVIATPTSSGRSTEFVSKQSVAFFLLEGHFGLLLKLHLLHSQFGGKLTTGEQENAQLKHVFWESLQFFFTMEIVQPAPHAEEDAVVDFDESVFCRLQVETSPLQTSTAVSLDSDFEALFYALKAQAYRSRLAIDDAFLASHFAVRHFAEEAYVVLEARGDVCFLVAVEEGSGNLIARRVKQDAGAWRGFALKDDLVAFLSDCFLADVAQGVASQLGTSCFDVSVAPDNRREVSVREGAGALCFVVAVERSGIRFAARTDGSLEELAGLQLGSFDFALDAFHLFRRTFLQQRNIRIFNACYASHFGEQPEHGEDAERGVQTQRFEHLAVSCVSADGISGAFVVPGDIGLQPADCHAEGVPARKEEFRLQLTPQMDVAAGFAVLCRFDGFLSSCKFASLLVTFLPSSAGQQGCLGLHGPPFGHLFPGAGRGSLCLLCQRRSAPDDQRMR